MEDFDFFDQEFSFTVVEIWRSETLWPVEWHTHFTVGFLPTFDLLIAPISKLDGPVEATQLILVMNRLSVSFDVAESVGSEIHRIVLEKPRFTVTLDWSTIALPWDIGEPTEDGIVVGFDHTQGCSWVVTALMESISFKSLFRSSIDKSEWLEFINPIRKNVVSCFCVEDFAVK